MTYEEVQQIIDEILMDNNLQGKIKINYGKTLNIPEEISVLQKTLGWYLYKTGDRGNGYYDGPYDVNALIGMLIYSLPLKIDVKEDFVKKFPSKKMDDGDYFDNQIFYSEFDIDAYEAEHPEKKVE